MFRATGRSERQAVSRKCARGSFRSAARPAERHLSIAATGQVQVGPTAAVSTGSRGACPQNASPNLIECEWGPIRLAPIRSDRAIAVAVERASRRRAIVHWDRSVRLGENSNGDRYLALSCSRSRETHRIVTAVVCRERRPGVGPQRHFGRSHDARSRAIRTTLIFVVQPDEPSSITH